MTKVSLADPESSRTRDEAEAQPVDDFAPDVRTGLAGRPKQLPPRYLYDDLGSALFDAICRLPWYRVTRAELGLLARHGAEIAASLTPPVTLVELGSGSGEKLALLLAAMGGDVRQAHVHLVDISRAALDQASEALRRLGPASVHRHQATYRAGLDLLAGTARRDGDMRLVLFLGSNIGNFDPPDAADRLARIRRMLRPGDALLVGADLVKPEPDLLAAYDDPLGVTAAFNRNLLVRINRELGGTFDLAAFAHEARWNADASRVDMHLVSGRRQSVSIPGAGCRVEFAEGETIWTESSYKYDQDAIIAVVNDAGFRVRDQWIDPDARFALTMFQAV